jgi:hypothetical protein
VPLSLVGDRMSPHRIVQMIRARNSVFAAYIAALDQEQTAAAIYAESISELERRLPDSDPDRGSEPRATSG